MAFFGSLRLKLFQSATYLAILVTFFITAQGSGDDNLRSLDPDPGEYTCRSRGVDLSPAHFQLQTCALCYLYMPPNQFHFSWTRTSSALVPSEKIGPLASLSTPPIILLTDGNITIPANHSDVESPLISSFISEVSYHLWRECCASAVECCNKMIKNKKSKSSNQVSDTTRPVSRPDPLAPVRCPPTWDGWQCWEDGGSPGRIVYQACPSYIYFHTGTANDGGQLMQNTCGRYAEKNCTASGEWFRKSSGGEWTDFTTCSRVNALLLQEHAHMGLYAVSATALLPAIIIFFSYKVLRVPRIAIHKNMFASLLLHCIFMVTFKEVVLLPYIQATSGGSSLLGDNTGGCRFLLMLTMYFRLTNYTWMFCEGYYLHRLLANTFEEERSLAFILTIGWGVPIIPCTCYALLRLFFDDSLCWALPAGDENGWIEWVYMAPGLICILANFVFFINIFRILVTKLQAPHANEPAHFRKAVRATVVLLPLFGLHWLLTLYRPQSGHCLWTSIYKYVNVILDGLQGLMVSIAFCYRNGEIRNLLRTSWNRFRENFCHQDYATSMQLSEFHRGGSETCFTQVPPPKSENNHNDEQHVTSNLLPPSYKPKPVKSVIVLEPHYQHSSCAPSPSTRSINSNLSGSNF